MLRSGHVASALVSLAWRISVSLVGAAVLVGICLKDSDGPAVGAERAEKGGAVFSERGTKVLVTLAGAVAGDFSTCIIQNQQGTEIARVNSYCSGQITFQFGSSSPVRGSGSFHKDGEATLGVMSDAMHLYNVLIEADGSSVVHAVLHNGRGERVRTIRLSPKGDVLSERP